MNFLTAFAQKEFFAIVEREVLAYAPMLQASILAEIASVLTKGIQELEAKLASMQVSS